MKHYYISYRYYDQVGSGYGSTFAQSEKGMDTKEGIKEMVEYISTSNPNGIFVGKATVIILFFHEIEGDT
jgi:hypothetical protein